MIALCLRFEADDAAYLRSLGRYLKTHPDDRRFCRGLGNMLSSRTGGKPHLQLKKKRGRPSKPSSEIINDPLAWALDEADLNIIGNHLREPNVDPRAVIWCAEKLDPASLNNSRFILVQTGKRRGRPLSRPDLTRGRMIDEKLRALGYYDGKKVLNRVLNFIVKKCGTSRSTARRDWVSYCELENKKRGPIRTQ